MWNIVYWVLLAITVSKCLSYRHVRQADISDGSTQRPPDRTPRPPFVISSPISTRYTPPQDLTWVQMGYDANFDGRAIIPATLSGLPGCRAENKLFFKQMQNHLQKTGSQVGKALRGEIDLSSVPASDFKSISNTVLSGCAGSFLSSMSIAQQKQASEGTRIGVMGLNNLIQNYISNESPNPKGNNLVLFSTPSVRCGVLTWKLQGTDMDVRLVSYKSLYSLSYDELVALKPFLNGMTLTMARSFLQRANPNVDGDKKTAVAIDSFPGTDWGDNLAVCSALFLAVYSNINEQVDQWNLQDYPNLKDKIVPMFACVKPSYLQRFRFNQLWPMIDEVSAVDFDWQRGSALVQQIFHTARNSDFSDRFFRRLDRLNKYLTVDLLTMKKQDDLFMNILLTKSSLVSITEFTSDPLLLEWLYSEVRARLYPQPLSDYSRADDVYLLGTMVAAMTVADIRQFSKETILRDIGAFQSKGLSVGQMFILTKMYLEYGNYDPKPLESSDLERLRRLIPAVGYQYFMEIGVESIVMQISMLRDMADRRKHKHSLTAAQKFLITQKLIVSDKSKTAQKIVSTLGPHLSMELSPSVYLRDLTSLDILGLTVTADGEVIPTDVGTALINSRWTKFQKTVFFQLYRKAIGNDSELQERTLLMLQQVASGIPVSEIFRSQFTDIVGITAAVMRHSDDMGQAWLLSLQLRRAFSAMHGLESIDQFDLSLLGTANIHALDSLTLRMFSVKEMEGLSAADCQDVVSKIGSRKDVYLMPHPKRRELVCFYIERCRFDYSSVTRRYSPASTLSILHNYNTQDRRIQDPRYRYPRKVFDYCANLTPASLTSQDFEVLGSLVCDLPASILSAPNFPNDILWMFSDCLFDKEQGKAMFDLLTVTNQDLLFTDTTLSQLGHSLCSVVPPSVASDMRSKRYRKEVIDYVHYAYDYAKKQQRKHGLAKKHLNKDLFWSRAISVEQQSRIEDCYIRLARNALDFFRDYERNMILDQIAVYDERLALNPSSVLRRPVYTPKQNLEEYYDINNVNNNNNNKGNQDKVYDFNDNSNDNTADVNSNNGGESAYDFGDGNSNINSRQKREYFDYYQQKITCPEVHVLNTGNRLWTLRDLEWMAPEELSRCVFHFGKSHNLTFQQRTVLKDKVGMLVGGWEHIPPEYLIQLENIAMAMQDSEIRRLNLGDMQVNYFLGEWPWKKWQRDSLFENIRRRFNFYPSSMELYEIKALGELICGMRPKDMARIYTETYFDLAFFFGELTTCHYEQLRVLLPKAKSVAAFGPISKWTDAEVTAVGSPIAGMSVRELDSLTPSKNARGQNLVAAIPPHVIPLIPGRNMKRMRVEFYQALTVEQVIAMTPSQWFALSDGQAFAAMDIWFGFDNWPMSFLRDLQTSGSSVWSSSSVVPYCVLFLFYSLYMYIF